MSTLSNCGAHPHDGLSVDSGGNVWFDEEFANVIGELIPAAAIPPPPATAVPGTPPGTGTGIPSLAPTRNAAPVIHGMATQGRVLTADRGSWANGPTGFLYTWQRCNPRCASVARGMSSSHRLTAHDIGARVRVIVMARNAAGSAQAISRSVGPVGPSRGRVEAALSRLLAASTGRATISSLRRRSRDRAPFRAPSRGTLVVSWRGKGVAVATMRRRFRTAGARRVTIPISASGKRLLRRAHRLTLIAKSVYIPAGARAVTSAKRFTLTAR
jgi:hypothetical protein